MKEKIKKILNKKVDCSWLVKKNEDGSYDVTGVFVAGIILGALAYRRGEIIGDFIRHKIGK